MKIHEPSMDITGYLPMRLSDKWGAGWFGAPRGDRTHKGVDYSAYPRTAILSITYGTVTKIGYTYADNLSFRYIQVTQYGNANIGAKIDYRYFYVQPKANLKLGNLIHAGDVLGEVQDLTKRYPDIINHMHLSIKQDGVHINPVQFLSDMRG
jgi:murein DD-endopeptidase MepM/ murein hydrolase activator NlpD